MEQCKQLPYLKDSFPLDNISEILQSTNCHNNVGWPSEYSVPTLKVMDLDIIGASDFCLFRDNERYNDIINDNIIEC